MPVANRKPAANLQRPVPAEIPKHPKPRNQFTEKRQPAPAFRDLEYCRPTACACRNPETSQTEKPVYGEETASPGVSGFGILPSHGLCLPKSRNIPNREISLRRRDSQPRRFGIWNIAVPRLVPAEIPKHPHPKPRNQSTEKRQPAPAFRDLEGRRRTACACRNPETSQTEKPVYGEETAISGVSGFGILPSHGLCLPKSRNIPNRETSLRRRDSQPRRFGISKVAVARPVPAEIPKHPKPRNQFTEKRQPAPAFRDLEGRRPTACACRNPETSQTEKPVCGEETASPGVSGFGRSPSHGLCLPESRNIQSIEASARRATTLDTYHVSPNTQPSLFCHTA